LAKEFFPLLSSNSRKQIDHDGNSDKAEQMLIQKIVYNRMYVVLMLLFSLCFDRLMKADRIYFLEQQ
jgi:hypothetical protein